jgi:glycosyltransferase involved in cell wall biosynthesis
MASGLPVVAAGATGSASLVAEGVTGRLVAPTTKDADAAAFAEALAPYCTDPALRAAHGAAGETRACEYSWEAINAVVADTYVRLVEARRALQAAEAA